MMFVGMQERLYKEIQSLAPSAVKIRVIDPPERYSFYSENSASGSEAPFFQVSPSSKTSGSLAKNTKNTAYKSSTKNASDYYLYILIVQITLLYF